MKRFPRKLAAAGVAFSLACAAGPANVNAAPADMLSGFLKPSAFYSGPVVPPYGFPGDACVDVPVYGVPCDMVVPPYGFFGPWPDDCVTPDYGIPCDDYVVPEYGFPCDDYVTPDYGIPCGNYAVPEYGFPCEYQGTQDRNPQPAVRGDINGDGRVTSADATMLARAIAGHFDDDPDFELSIATADINRDGIINVDDLVKLARWLVGHRFPNGI